MGAMGATAPPKQQCTLAVITVGWQSHTYGYYIGYTRPKLRFLHVLSYQNMTFPHISYTYQLAEDRAKFYANK